MARQQPLSKKNRTTQAPIKKERAKAIARPEQYMTLWLIGLCFFLPMLYTNITMDPQVPVRYIFMSAFVLLFGAYFFAFRDKLADLSIPALVKMVFAAGIGYAIWSLVSAMGALNPREGYYEIGRHLLNIIFLFVVMVTVIREEFSLLKLCKALMIVAIIQSVVGIFQYYDIGFTNIPGDAAQPHGLMANRNLFGSAQAFMLPFAGYVLYKASGPWKYLAGIAIAGLFISVFLSQTRSAWLASVAFLLASLVLVFIFSKANRKIWFIGTAAAAGCIALFVFLILSADTEGTLKKSTIERTQSLAPGGVSGDDHSVENAQERIKMWKKTLELIKDDPITGAGPGNWRITVPKYGSEGLSWYYGQFTPDRPHNVYLLVTSETGIPGAIIYFGMWLLIAIAGFKVIRNPKTEDQRILVILMLAGLASLASDSMFSFPTERLEHSMYIYIMAGIILGIYVKNADKTDLVSDEVKKLILWIGGAILLFNVFIGLKKYKFETHFKQAKVFELQKQWRNVIAEVEKGKNNFVTLGPDVSTPLEIKSAIAYKELKEYDNSLREIKIAQKYHPYNSRLYSTEGTVYTERGEFDKAIACYERGLKINPMYDVLLKNLAINYFMAGNYKGTIETLGKLKLEGDQMFTQLMNDAKTKMAEEAKAASGTIGK